MNSEFAPCVDKMLEHGWQVHPIERHCAIPENILLRYPWLTSEVISFVCSFESVISPSAKAWLVSCSDLLGESGAAFAWNEWEMDSLLAAEDDADWQRSIKAFWNRHFPILLSVKSGYAYVALRDDLTLVVGEEPEFEETAALAPTFKQFLDMLADGDVRLDRFV